MLAATRGAPATARARRRRGSLGGVLIAAAIALPNFVWQAAHGYPMWTLLRDADEYKNAQLSPLQYSQRRFLITHPLLAPVSLIGLVTLLRRSDARFLGVAYLVLIAQMIALHGKDYYPGDVYPILIAAGAVTIEAWTETRGLLAPRARRLRARGRHRARAAAHAGLAGTHDVGVRSHRADDVGS